MSIFDSPQETVARAERLAELSIELNPNCQAANFEQFSLKCIQMNFSGALELAPDLSEHPLGDFEIIANHFKQYSFDHEHRPTIEELAIFLRAAAELPPERFALMERIVSYDFDLRTAKQQKEYQDVVFALIQYRNQHHPSFDFEYDRDKRSLRMNL